MTWLNAICAALATLCLGTTSQAELIAVEFAVPAQVQGTAEADCVVAPNFSVNTQHAEVYAAIKALIGPDGTATLLRSSLEEILERRGTRIEGFWEKAREFKTASCVSKCVRLPVGAKVVRLTFTDEDGRTECLRKSVGMDHLPSISDLSCGSTVWRDIAALGAGDNTPMLCATAVAWLTLPEDRRKPGIPATQNRLLIEYDLPVQ